MRLHGAERPAVAERARSQIGACDVMRSWTGHGSSDAELLAATRTQPDAFAAFYDRYETAVVGYLLRAHPRRRDRRSTSRPRSSPLRPCGARRVSRAARLRRRVAVHHRAAQAHRQRFGAARSRRAHGDGSASATPSTTTPRTSTGSRRWSPHPGWATELLRRLPADQRERDQRPDPRRAHLRARSRASSRPRRSSSANASAADSRRCAGAWRSPHDPSDARVPSAADHRSGAAPRRSTRFRRAGRHRSARPALAVVLVALAIAAGAVLALRHHSSGHGAPGRTSPPANGPTADRQGRPRAAEGRAGSAAQRPAAALSPTIIPLAFRPVAPMPKGTLSSPTTPGSIEPLARAVRRRATTRSACCRRAGAHPERTHRQ